MPKFFKMYTKTYQNLQQIVYKMHIFDLMCEKEQQEQEQQEQQFSRSMDRRLSLSKNGSLFGTKNVRANFFVSTPLHSFLAREA